MKKDMVCPDCGHIRSDCRCKIAPVSNSNLIDWLAIFKVGDRVRCAVPHHEPCMPDGVGVIDRIIPPDSAYLKAENGDNIGTRGLCSLKKC